MQVCIYIYIRKYIIKSRMDVGYMYHQGKKVSYKTKEPRKERERKGKECREKS